jgi:hypothetical protein
MPSFPRLRLRLFHWLWYAVIDQTRVEDEHRIHRKRGTRAKDDRTVSGLDGLQYALKYVVNVHGWHFTASKLLIAEKVGYKGVE